MATSKVGGRKRCSCKKSECLKLYCECFSRGYYCDEHCSCQGCYNTEDYEDTVDDARQQIVLKNPIAFSPKIENEDVGKHKKGCNCKKSMCAKKYCECYQANVGCSAECRCEGCQNVFGKKGGCTLYNEVTALTPFQHSGHGVDASTTDFSTGRVLTRPDNPTDTSNSNPILESIVHSEQQSYPEFMNQSYLDPMMDLPQMMDHWPNSSEDSGNYSSVISWPDSLATQVSPFGGPEVNNSIENPQNTVNNNSPDETTQQVTSSGDKSSGPY